MNFPATHNDLPEPVSAGLGSPVSAEMADAVAERFAILAEPMRIRLLDQLRQAGEASVQELADALEARHANVSKHLGLLRQVGMVDRRKVGTRAVYRITDESVFELCDLVCGGIRRQLDELSSFFSDAGIERSMNPVTNEEATSR